MGSNLVGMEQQHSYLLLFGHAAVHPYLNKTLLAEKVTPSLLLFLLFLPVPNELGGQKSRIWNDLTTLRNLFGLGVVVCAGRPELRRSSGL